MTTKLRRKIGFTLVLIWFAVLITWMLSLSQVAVSTGLRVYGSQDHITNQSTVIRVVGLDTKANYPVAISDVQYRWITPTQTSIWAPLEFTERLAWQTECTAPSEPGIATLEVRAQIRGDLVTAQTKLAIQPNGSIENRPQLRSPPTIRWQTPKERKLLIAPLDGVVQRGFENTFVLFVDDNSPPPSISYIDATQRTQVISIDASDVENIYTFKLTPNVGELALTLSSPEAVGRVDFPTVLAYFKVLAPDTQLDHINATIESRDQDGNILVDLWRGPYWLHTSRLKGRNRLNPVQFATRTHSGESVWVQAYTNPFNPRQAQGGQYVFIGRIGHQVLTEWRTSPKMRPFHRIEDSKHRNRFIRGRLVPPDNQPKLIADSSRYQTPEGQADRQYWMRIVSALLAMSTVAVLLVVILRVMRHRKHLEKRFEEMDEEDDLLENGGELKTSLRDGIILLIFVGVLIAGVGWLFFTARW